MFTTIVCPIDFSEPSTRALDYAIALAARERGPHGARAAAGARPGSVAYRVLCLAAAPVLALPSGTDAST